MIRFPHQISRHLGCNIIAVNNLVQKSVHNSVISLGKILGLLVKFFQVRRLLFHTSLPTWSIISPYLCNLGEDLIVLMRIS